MRKTIKQQAMTLALGLPIGHIFDVLNKIAYPIKEDGYMLIELIVGVCIYYSCYQIAKKILS
jgi:hypothetical protein